jgi:hypothetical protein
MLLLESAIKHPQAPQGMELKCSDSGIVAECMRSEVAVLRQSNSHRRTGTERSFCEVERSTASVKRRGKNISQPLAFLIQVQSDNGANPDGCAKEQPLKTLRAADIILLECSVA